MARGWGIPRTMAEVHALLFIMGEPMNADEVIDRLGISRGSASMTLRRLVEWGIVSRVPRGPRTRTRSADRKEYFRAEQDVWKMLRTIIEQRKKREVDPLLEALAECRCDPGPGCVAPEGAHNDRVDALIGLMQQLDRLGTRVVGPGGGIGLRLAAQLLERTG